MRNKNRIPGGGGALRSVPFDGTRDSVYHQPMTVLTTVQSRAASVTPGQLRSVMGRSGRRISVALM